MKAKVILVKGNKQNLTTAFKRLEQDRGVRSLTIYKTGQRFRMMIGGFLTVDEVVGLVKDDSLKIAEFQPT